jgi:hypothetical protein
MHALDGFALPDWWTTHFGVTPPLGYRLRVAYPERWFRIHSLPNSKRYPSTAAELELLLDRHAAVAAELSELARTCTLVTPTYEAAELGARRIVPELGARELECIASHHDAEADVDVSYWAAECRWDPCAERPVLIAIAQDQLRALWLDRGSGNTYAPYDGGADLFVSDPERRADLLRKYATWRSARADGL